MSYILDALQRADAERERGQVPGLHTPTGQPGAPATPRPGWPAAVWLLAAVAAIALGGAVWWWLKAPAPSAGAGSQSLAAAPKAAAPSPAPNVQPPARSAPSPVVVPLLASAPPALPSPTVRPQATPPAAAISMGATDAPRSTAEAAAPAPVRSFAELSPEARAQLPAVNVTGSTYSQNPAHRMLIANGKVVQEGQEIAPGLVLESMGPRSAVLNHRGLRYSVGY